MIERRFKLPSKDFVPCEDCGKLMKEPKVFYTKKAMLFLCEECQEERRKEREMRQVSLLDF